MLTNDDSRLIPLMTNLYIVFSPLDAKDTFKKITIDEILFKLNKDETVEINYNAGTIKDLPLSFRNF